jgi:hypothetical protein
MVKICKKSHYRVLNTFFSLLAALNRLDRKLKINLAHACVVSGLIKLRELVRNEHDVDVYLRQVTPDSYRRVLKEIKAKEIYNLVVDTRPENMQHFLKGVNTHAARHH